MRRSRSRSRSIEAVAVALVAASAFAVSLTTSGVARAEDDCPPGSRYKTEGDFKWCEPSVCATDAQCSAGEVCKPMALCVQVGKVDTKTGGDAGERLIATQRCGADQHCPNTTVCTEKSRCISRAQADKLGMTTVNVAGSASAAPASPAEAPKKSCGCHVPGTRGSELAGLGLAMAGLAAAATRRRRR